MRITKSMIGAVLMVIVADVGPANCLVGHPYPEQEPHSQAPQAAIAARESENKVPITGEPMPVRTKNGDFEVVGAADGVPISVNPPVLLGSQAVRLKGVEFRVVVEPKCAFPEGSKIHLGLSVTNRGEELLAFNLTDTLRPMLKSSTGRDFEWGYEREEEGEEPPLLVPPGKTVTRLIPAYRARWSGENDLALTYAESGGDWWVFGLAPGKYHLSFKYSNDLSSLKYEEKMLSLWIGEFTTKEVVFEITAP